MMSIHQPLEDACASGPHAGALVSGRTISQFTDGAGARRLFAIAREHAARTGLPLVVVLNAMVDQEGEARVRGAAGLLVRSVTEPQRAASLAGATFAAPASVPAELWAALGDAGATLGAEGIVLAPAGWSIVRVFRLGQKKPILSAAAEDDPELATADVVASLEAAAAQHELRATYC